MKNFTVRELELLDHALSYMFSNLDDVNECFEGDFDAYTEEEVQAVRDKIETKPVWFQDPAMQEMFEKFLKKGETIDAASKETIKRFKEYDN